MMLTTDPIRARSASRSTSGNTEWTSPFRHGHSFSRCTSCSRTRDTISKIFAECASARCLTRRTICPPLRRRCHLHSILSRESAATDRTHTRLTTARQDSGTAGYAARRVYHESCVDPSQRRPNHQLRHATQPGEVTTRVALTPRRDVRITNYGMIWHIIGA